MKKLATINVSMPIEVIERIDQLTNHRSDYITFCVMKELKP